jgi:hypothetical protein
MSINKIRLGAIVMIIFAGSVIASAEDIWDRFDFVFGPRVGFSYVTMDADEFTRDLQKVPMFNRDSYFPFTSQFGVSLEQRVLLGTTKSHFVFEEVLLLGGVDQSIAIPTAAILLGYRSEFGLELGLGPVWSLSGLSVVYSVGWTFVFSDVYIPINIAFVPDFTYGHHNFNLFTGFNFNVD